MTTPMQERIRLVVSDGRDVSSAELPETSHLGSNKRAIMSGSQLALSLRLGEKEMRDGKERVDQDSLALHEGVSGAYANVMYILNRVSDKGMGNIVNSINSPGDFDAFAGEAIDYMMDRKRGLQERMNGASHEEPFIL
jgi:hypothetical protein